MVMDLDRRDMHGEHDGFDPLLGARRDRHLNRGPARSEPDDRRLSWPALGVHLHPVQ